MQNEKLGSGGAEEKRRAGEEEIRLQADLSSF
jgi:hypothetical protein